MSKITEKDEMLMKLGALKVPEKSWKNLYSVKDLKVGYGPVFYSTNDMTALRSFSDDINRKVQQGQNPLNEHPEDYEIWKIGRFCLETAEIENEIKYLGRALDYLKPNTSME